MDKKDFFKEKPFNETGRISFIPEEMDFTIEDKKESYLIVKYDIRGHSELCLKILVDKSEVEFFAENENDVEYFVNHQKFEESKKLIKEEAKKYLTFLQQKHKAHFLKNVFKENN